LLEETETIEQTMKKTIFTIIGASLLFQVGLFAQNTDYTKFVNPFIGTGAVDSVSLSGSNFPGACLCPLLK
jgi:hypothetical protein